MQERRDEMTDASASLIGSFVGTYRIEQIIAQGRATTIYRARAPQTGSTAALTAIRTRLISEHTSYEPFMDHFMRVGAQLVSLSHPHIVRILDYGEHAEYAYMLSEDTTNSESLARRLKREPQLTVSEITSLLSQLCSALEYAHANGVVHGNLKPSAALMTPSGHLQVIGLGMVTILEALGGDDQHAQKKSIYLSDPVYLAPERLMGHSASVQSDIYALGILLFELVSGSAPSAFATEGRGAAGHGRQAIPSLATRCPEIPLARSLDEILHIALAPLPELRFRSVRELWEAYEALIVKGEAREGHQLRAPRRNIEEVMTTPLVPITTTATTPHLLSPIPIPSTGALPVLPQAGAIGLDQAALKTPEVLTATVQEMIWNGSLLPTMPEKEPVFSLPLGSISSSGPAHTMKSGRGAIIGLGLCLLLFLFGVGCGAWMVAHAPQGHHLQAPTRESQPMTPLPQQPAPLPQQQPPLQQQLQNNTGAEQGPLVLSDHEQSHQGEADPASLLTETGMRWSRSKQRPSGHQTGGPTLLL